MLHINRSLTETHSAFISENPLNIANDETFVFSREKLIAMGVPGQIGKPVPRITVEHIPTEEEGGLFQIDRYGQISLTNKPPHYPENRAPLYPSKNGQAVYVETINWSGSIPLLYEEERQMVSGSRINIRFINYDDTGQENDRIKFAFLYKSNSVDPSYYVH